MGVRLVVFGKESQGDEDLALSFDQERIVIGRGIGADLCIPHQAVSDRHAVIERRGSGYVIIDDGSTNGTRVNGERLQPGRPKALRSGDLVGVAGHRVAFEEGLPVAVPASAERTAEVARRLLREVFVGRDDAIAPPLLRVMNGPEQGRVLEVPPPPVRLIIGRATTASLCLSDADASREHAEVIRDLDGIWVRDLGGKNPLLVNDKAVRERRLRDRDELLVGSTAIVFEDEAEQILQRLAEQPDLPAPDHANGADGGIAAEGSAAEDAPPCPDSPSSAGAGGVEDDARGDGTGGRRSPSSPAGDGPGPDGASAATGEGKKLAAVGDAAKLVTPRVGRGRSRADLLIYVLAAVVLAISAAGLYVLFRPAP